MEDDPRLYPDCTPIRRRRVGPDGAPVVDDDRDPRDQEAGSWMHRLRGAPLAWASRKG
jgi:hypothetical protein